ncbi:MAG: recombinase family protein [Thermodesulfobacteriota bacterium]
MDLSLLYVRVSSLDQERDGYSLDAQEKLGHEYAHRKELEIKRMWKVSESAWHKERKAFNQLVEYAKKHTEIKHIIFDITDRMTRNDLDKLKIYNLIKDYDKTNHFSRSNKILNKHSGSDDEFMFDRCCRCEESIKRHFKKDNDGNEGEGGTRTIPVLCSAWVYKQQSYPAYRY